MITVWVVDGESESSDRYLAVFQIKPTEAQLKELVHSWDGDEVEEGPGYAGSYVHITVGQYQVQ